MRHASRRGGILPVALAITFTVLVIGFALAMLGTSNLQLANYEANRQKALEVARAGLNQYLYDMDNRPQSKPPVVLTTMANFSMILLSPALQLPAQRAPYPIPGTRLDGDCYITFNHALKYYSVDNFTSTTAADGWRGAGSVPPYCLDLIATGVVNGLEKHVEVLVSRRWDYALSTPCPIDISGTEIGGNQMPSVIDGDVFTAASFTPGGDAIINVGRRKEAASWITSGNNTITGYLRVATNNTSAVYVGMADSNSVAGTKFGSTEKNYPNVSLPDSAGWTDLAAEFAPANKDLHRGAWLNTYVDGSGDTCYSIESDGSAGTTEFVVPAGNYVLNGNLVGSNAAGDASSATDIVLNGASLKVQGKVSFSEHPKRLYGNQAVLWVTGALVFYDGFIDGGDNGLVLYAHSISTRAGGCLKGLVLVENELKMEPFDKTLSDGTADATTFDRLRVKSASSGIQGSYYKLAGRRLAGMYIRGGVFTPQLPTNNFWQMLLALFKRFSFRSVNLAWDPTYLKSLHKFADPKICYWQEIP